MTHYYKRTGRTMLFAALDIKSGMVIGKSLPRHRAKEFLHFLRPTGRAVVKPCDAHLVLDSHATHKAHNFSAWLANQLHYKLHFSPDSAPSLNIVERFFVAITTNCIRGGSYTSVGGPEAAIYDYLGQYTTKQKPFTWNKTAADILTGERCALDKLDGIRGNKRPASDLVH